MYIMSENYNANSTQTLSFLEVVRTRIAMYMGSTEQARRSMFTEEFQRFEQLIPDKDTFELLGDLMGKDSAPKHDFIFDNLDFSEIRE